MREKDRGTARRSDGLELAWEALGDGPPLACCNGVGVSTFFWKYLEAEFSPSWRVITWDYAGHGRSEVPKDPATTDLGIPQCADDLAAVLDAAGAADAPAVLVGHSMGCQVILEFAHRYPARTAALVPMLGTFGKPLDTFFDQPRSRDVFEWVRRAHRLGGRSAEPLLRRLWKTPYLFELARHLGLVDPWYAQREDIQAYLSHLQVLDVSVFMRMVGQMADHDAGPYLGEIHVPTLVIAGDRDIYTPMHRAEEMARRIDGAELFVLTEGTHAALVEQPAAIHHRLHRFFRERL